MIYFVFAQTSFWIEKLHKGTSGQSLWVRSYYTIFWDNVYLWSTIRGGFHLKGIKPFQRQLRMCKLKIPSLL